MLQNDIPDHNVTVQWVENGQLKKIQLTPGHSAIYQSQLLVSMKGYIRLTAFNDRYIPARVNGNLFFDMEPRDDDAFVNISITPKELGGQSLVTPKVTQNQQGGGDSNSNNMNATSNEQQQQQQQHIYYMSPSFKNTGMKTVTFRLPPQGGKLTTLPPYSQSHMNIHKSGTTKPDDWVVEFSEGNGEKKYNLTLGWTLKPTNVDVSVGNGKVTVATTEASGHHEAGDQASQGFVPQSQGASGGDSEKQGAMSKLGFFWKS